MHGPEMAAHDLYVLAEQGDVLPGAERHRGVVSLTGGMIKMGVDNPAVPPDPGQAPDVSNPERE